MCGRFSLISSEELIKRIFRLNRAPVQLRFNIAPSQDVSVIRISRDKAEREMVTMRWGLVPPWAKDVSFGNRTINAKSETLFEKPSFRKAARVRRCLIPADGFYEWKKEKKEKQPYYIRLRDESPFGFAGLWETWKDSGNEPLQSITIVTTEANELMKPVHHRMPVIVPPGSYDAWLDPEHQNPETIASMLRPYPADEMKLYPVSTAVNNPRNDGPQCIEPVSESLPDEMLLF